MIYICYCLSLCFCNLCIGVRILFFNIFKVCFLFNGLLIFNDMVSLFDGIVLMEEGLVVVLRSFRKIEFLILIICFIFVILVLMVILKKLE